MEKKTIGKFISTLRKANGLTQKELGEKLFVSDKTVSRWECDECTPELSLIPSIAEIFGITTDELLRGERNNPDMIASSSQEFANKQKARSDKQFRLMLDRTNRQYKNLTLISIGITIFGLIAAIIVNFGFSNGLIAFCLAAAFCISSEIAQICFAINARITNDEDDYSYADKIQKANNDIAKTAIIITFINILLFTFCLPLVSLYQAASYGVEFGSWLLSGLAFSANAFVVCYIIYTYFVHKALVSRHIIILDEKKEAKSKLRKKILSKTIRTSVCVAIVIYVCIVIWNIIGLDTFLEEKNFDNCEDFKEFIENDYDEWYHKMYGYVLVNGEIVDLSPADPNYPHNVVNHKYINSSIINSNGEEICSYYYNPDLYWKIEFTPSADDKMPVTVITAEAVKTARNIFFTIESAMYVLIVVNFVVAAIVYIIKIRKDNKKSTS